MMNTHTSAYNIKPRSVEDEVITDEFEGILGIEDDENLPSELQLFQDADFDGDFGVKAESSCRYWDFDDKKTCLNLSLNYQEVLEAWSNRGPLWADPSNTYEVQGTTWSRRQTSVMRYKEKRQSRLFSKKIRYQVRKLNADQRPRIKGRFVKRQDAKRELSSSVISSTC